MLMPGARSPAAAAPTAPGDQLWVSRENGSANTDDYGRAAQLSPDGTKVFATGYMTGSSSHTDYATVAYDASTGTKMWLRRYNGPANSEDYAWSLAVSPDGTRLFVTGESPGVGTFSDYATLAYDASTGATLWTRRYNGPGSLDDFGNSVTVSPDGAEVFVTGDSDGPSGSKDYATLAYDASSGATLWESRYNGPADAADVALLVKVTPDGTRVVVTGSSEGSTFLTDYATVAYDASTGSSLWTKRYNGPGNGDDYAYSLGVSPDGTRVFVTGGSGGSGTSSDYATLAYDASTGSMLWSRRFNGAGNGDDYAYSLGVSPDGTRVFVTGDSTGSALYTDYATLAYDASTGTVLWKKRYDGPTHYSDYAWSVAASPVGTNVLVTGYSPGSDLDFDYTTVAYEGSAGTVLWTRRYDGPANEGDYAYAVAVSPDGSKVAVTGGSFGSGTSYDFVTVAYSTV